MVLFSVIICLHFILSAFAAPSTASHLPRDSVAATHDINATTIIHDHNGLDITSSFKVMIYHQPSPKAGATNAGKEFNDRRTRMTQFAKLVNACPANETFVNSHCDPESGGESAMQKYVYTCRRTENVYSVVTGHLIGSRPIFRVREGHCQPTEICISGHVPALIAACVEHWVFDDYTIGKDGILRPMLGGVVFSLDNFTMYSAVSQSDKSTPVEVDRLNVEALAGNEIVQRQTCRGCTELTTTAFQPDTDSLKVEARLLTAGAMAGILWLGFMSG